MKRFLKHLNEFINWREYKRRTDSEKHRLQWELKYAQDLLIHETSSNTNIEKQGEITLYVAYLKHCRAEEKRYKESLGEWKK